MRPNRTHSIRWPCVFIAAAWSLPGAAQDPLYVDVTGSHYSGESDFACMDAAAADADGDGDLDLALAVEFGTNRLLRNDGSGRLVQSDDALPASRHDSEDVAFADFDGDGDLDLVFVSEDDRRNELYLNDGSGTFRDVSDRIPVDGTSNALAVTDIDNDGDPDILIGNIGRNAMLINDGSGNFREAGEDRWPNDSRTQDLEAVDIDGDGDIDIVEANEGHNRLYLNDGSGRLQAAPRALPSIRAESREIRATDLDGDGLLDLVVANVDFMLSESPRDYFLFNNGDHTFRRDDDNQHPSFDQDHFTTQAVDLDRDGDIDIIMPHTVLGLFGGSGNYQIMLNDGSGRFSPATENSIFPGILSGNGFDIEVADFNGDGEDDLFLCNRLSPQILLFYREPSD